MAQKKNSRSPVVAELHRRLLNTNTEEHGRLAELPELLSKGRSWGLSECSHGPPGV